MTLKITMTIDQESEQGLVLLGLLAKAYGRGEAGVNNLTIDRDDTSGRHVETWFQKPQRRPVPYATLAKLAARGKQFRGGTGTVILLRGLKQGASLDRLKALWIANGLSKNGVGATLSKLAQRGLAKRVDVGMWRLTPAGEAMEAEIESGTRDDRSQPQAE